MGIPPQFIAVPRMAGYLAHWLESLDDPDTKIMRPQQVKKNTLFDRSMTLRVIWLMGNTLYILIDGLFDWSMTKMVLFVAHE